MRHQPDDYCDQPASRHAIAPDDVLWVADANDQHTRWREATNH